MRVSFHIKNEEVKGRIVIHSHKDESSPRAGPVLGPRDEGIVSQSIVSQVVWQRSLRCSPVYGFCIGVGWVVEDSVLEVDVRSSEERNKQTRSTACPVSTRTCMNNKTREVRKDNGYWSLELLSVSLTGQRH